MEQNAVMSCPVPPDFWQPFFLNGIPFLLNEAPFLQKTAENGKNRPWQARTGCSSLSKYSNSMSFSVATSFFHVFTPFFLCFWPVYNRSRVCQNTVEGLSTLLQGSVAAVQGRFCTFPIKICLLMANLVAYWSNTTKRFLCSIVFVAISGKILSQTSFATRSRIALLCNTWATYGRLERRLNSRWKGGEA